MDRNEPAAKRGIGGDVSIQAMSIAAFQDLVDRCGHDPARWPDDARPAATALLARDEGARAILADAAHLADLARAHPAPKAPRGLADRIVATALEKDAARDAGGPPPRPAAKTPAA